MANTLTSKGIVYTPAYTLQLIEASFDTSGSAATVAAAFDQEPDELYCTCTSFGTDVINVELSFSSPNISAEPTVENSGTIGTHTYDIYVKWYDFAAQDGSTTDEF